MSQHALGEVLRRVQAGVSTHATIPPPTAAARASTTSLERRVAHRDGVLARRKARAALAEVTDQFDELLAGIEQIEAQVAQVMHAAGVNGGEGSGNP